MKRFLTNDYKSFEVDQGDRPIAKLPYKETVIEKALEEHPSWSSRSWWIRSPKLPQLLTETEQLIYKVPQCSLEELERIDKFHKRLNLSEIMTLKGMYIIFHQELKVLNLNKIHSLEQLCIKRKNYKRYLRKQRRRKGGRANG